MSAAVEAAAKAWFDRGQAARLDAGRKREDGQPWQWEDLTEDDRIGYRALARPVVEAAVTAERDRIEQAVLALRAKANPARDEVADSYRNALRDVRRVIEVGA